MKRIISAAVSIALVAASAWSSAAHTAEAWPKRPIHIIVPTPAGGGIDVVARLVALRLGAALGEQVIVENKPGARNTIAAEFVAKSAPDGYTLFVTSDAFTVMPFVERKLAFDVPGSFAPVSLLATQPLILAVHPSVPVQSMREFIALSKSKPGGISFGSGALGHYLAAEYLQKTAGFEMTHIPYKGGVPAITYLVGGQIPAALTGQSPMIQQVRAGRIRPLAVMSKARSTALPDVPTLAEAGIAGIDLFEWIFMLAPANTPKEIVARLNAELARVLAASDVRERLAGGGFDPAPNMPAQLGAMIRESLDRWGQADPPAEHQAGVMRPLAAAAASVTRTIG
jgi:tripartite-type tricarboxylate transporter receptor subunit TctC